MSDTEKHWQDRLTPAVYDGFQFLTESHDGKGGRRLVVHELPGADQPLVEDKGGKAWDWKLNAYFLGPDYDLERNGFLAKLAEPGAKWLTHPWLGLIWVRARDWSVHESNDKGGYCAIALEFVPGGEQPYDVQVDKVDVAYDRTAKLGDAAVDDFDLEPMSADGMTAFVAAVHQKLEVLRTVIALASLPLTWASQVQNLIAGVKGDLATLMAVPASYASALRGLTDVLGSGADDSDYADTDRPRAVARLVSVATKTGTTALTGVAATDGAVRRNLIREEALRSRLLLTSAAQVAMADYRSEGDRDAALDRVVTAIDLLLPNLPDTVFQAAVAARTALIEALLAQDLKPASYRDVVAPLPAVVLAYRLDVDESVFLARNKVRSPLFVRGRVYG